MTGGASAMTRLFFMSPLTSGFTTASDATAEPVVVVYGYSEAFEGFKEVRHIGLLNDRSVTEPR